MDPSSRHFDGRASITEGHGDIVDAVARTFFLGYTNPDAEVDYLKLPTNPIPSENLLITVTGLQDIDLATLQNLRGALEFGDIPVSGFPRLAELIEQTHGTEAKIVSISGSKEVAEGLLGSTQVEALTIDDNSDFKSTFGEGLDLTDLKVQEFIREMELFRSVMGSSFGSGSPGFYFATLVKFSQLPQGMRNEAASVLDEVIGEVLQQFAAKSGGTGVGEVLLIQNNNSLDLEMQLNAEAQMIRRLLSADTKNDSKSTTYHQVYTNQISYWVSITVALILYAFVYYMAFYGNYSADQMLYTSFNAKWDDRKMK